jgi:hypothetical protein
MDSAVQRGDHAEVPASATHATEKSSVLRGTRGTKPPVASDDVDREQVVAREAESARDIHKGEFMGIGPTDKPLTFIAIDIVRIAGGQIAERWSQADNLALLQ